MRKLFSILVALFATMSLLAHDFEIDKIYYNILSDTTVEVTYGGDSYWETYSADTIIIPSVVTYNGTSYSVVRIGSLAFYSCNISSITIPNSITSIGHNAFRYCRSLTTLIIPNGLESIEGGAFEECESLISITIPNSVTNIGGNAFYETGVYNDLSNWENDVLYIGDCLISTKTSISGAYEIKNQTRLIADGTFNECKSLTAITFPENVTSIGDITFGECSSLKSVIWNVKNPKNCGIAFFNTPISSFIFGENVAYIPAGLCQSMKFLTSVIIPENVISIGYAAFYGCSSLTSITLPNSLTSIGSRAFDGCFSLASIIIPYSVTDIGDHAFSSCYFSSDNFTNNSSLNAEENYYWGARIFDADEVNGLFIQNDTIVNCRPYVDTITIPSTVKYIQGTPFSECWYRSSIVVESGNAIYDSRENCNAIIETATNTLILGCQNTIIPNTVTSIGDAAFYGCVSITSITIPRSVTSIGDYAFIYCSSLTSITIPESVITIGRYAFEGTTWYNSKEDGVIYIGKVLYKYKGEMPANTSLDIIDGTLSISSEAFNGCSNLVSITIPESVTSIGDWAFSDCSSLTSATIGNSVTSIGEHTFSWCSSLLSITIPNNVTSIGHCAFYNCSSLTDITISENLTHIGDGAFSGCTAIKSVTWNAKNCKDSPSFENRSSIQSFTFGENVEYIPVYLCIGMGSLKSITIPNSVDSIGHDAFAGCSSLTSVTIGSRVKSIGSGAFEYSALKSVTLTAPTVEAYCNGRTNWLLGHSCTAPRNIQINGKEITEFIIPNSIDSIHDCLFIYCSSLTSVTIPNSVDNIGEYAFAYCDSLTSITIPESVMSVGAYAFHACSSLKSVTWNVKNHTDFEWSKWPFYQESPIQSFNFGENVEHIPAYICYSMDSLKSITIPESVNTIGDEAFYSCSALNSVTWNAKNCSDLSSRTFYYSPISSFTFGENVEYIPAYICYSMDSLKSITIPESVNTIGDEAFYSCSALNSVTWNAKNCSDLSSRTFYYSPISSFTFGENVEYIPAYLCYNQDSLRSVTIPNSVDSIGEYAFAYCDSLTSVAIGESVSKVGEYAFSNDFIKTVFSTPLLPPAIESNVFGWKVYDNATLHVLSSDYKTHDVWKQFDNIQVLDTIHSDGIRYKVINKSGKLLSESLLTEDSFNQFTRVSVAGTQTWRYDSQYGAKMSGFQDNVTHTNEDWFISPALDLEGCSSATLTFSHAFGPKSSIPTTDSQKAQYTIWVSNDFEGDVNAATWTELKGMIYGDTGWGFVSSGDITIPTENLKANCRVAWKYTCTTSSATWEIKDVSLFATIDTNAKPTLQVINGESPYSGDIVIPSIVKYMNADLEVSSISNIAFRDCSSLNSVTVENGVTTIEEYAFYNSSLTSISLPNTLTHIGYSAFRGCSSLISIAIPNGVTTIKNNTFSGCSSLTSATISNGVMAIEKYAFADCSSLNTISVPNSVTRIGQSTFKNCTSLVEVTLSNEMNTLEKETFQDCSSLKFVRLGGKLTTIGESVFSACTALNEITLPASVKSIGENAFAGCTKLYDIYCFAMEPPTAYESSFANYNAFLHVPCDNQRVYLLDVIFGNFKYIECIEAETTPTDTVVVTPSLNDAEFIWPSNSSADSYTLAISKDGEVFCTLTFNANGQLTGIAFAPSRNGQHNAPAAAQTANGFAFTVTGLDEGANYTYNLLIQDRSGNTLQSYSGEFRTQSVDDRIIMVEYDATQGEVIGAGTYLLGDIVTLTVIPNEGYQFATWGDGNTDNPRTLVVTQDTTLTAVFEILTYNVTVTCDPIHGYVTGSGTYNHGDVVTLTAIPNEGYQFVCWSNEVEDNPYTFVISDNVKLSAEFEVIIHSSVENTHSPSPISSCQKIFRNGQLLILRDGKTYNVMGQEM